MAPRSGWGTNVRVGLDTERAFGGMLPRCRTGVRGTNVRSTSVVTPPVEHLTMAAILETHHYPLADPPRPPRRAELRLVCSAPVQQRQAAFSGQTTVDVRVVLGAVGAVILAMFLAVAVGRGAFAALAPAPVQSAAAAPAATAGVGHLATRTVVVRPGDSMWSIARRVQPTGEIRGLVDELVSLHGSATIVPGQRIVIPS